MKIWKKILRGAVVLLCFFCSAYIGWVLLGPENIPQCRHERQAFRATPSLKSDTAAVVNGKVIDSRCVKRRVDLLEGDSIAILQESLRELVTLELLYQHAQKNGVEISPRAGNIRANIVASSFPSREEYLDFFKAARLHGGRVCPRVVSKGNHRYFCGGTGRTSSFGKGCRKP
ncbi:hypothetical protein [Chitinivibrio alkaliphilus]|uniref:Uncharacterized protein n=1 Tax=Chitinivibrio alkaliphilus ACht1 TaxID=1313304 RepID=U7D5J2_9BACT|nr:hypothetical protein [Chitinivibrio alkaliphilus]ERP31233.1 hypothetical protein CALK_1850 [Chitinivibrio alkaliphilus ACht1]